MYLKYNDNQQTFQNILGSFVAQLAQDYAPLPSTLRNMWERNRAFGTSPTTDDLSTALSEISRLFERVYIVVDALDECSDEIRWALVEKLQEIEVQLLMTSRFLESIDYELQGFERLEIKANKADLELFVDQHLRKNKNLQRIVQKSPTMSDDIKNAVVATAEDM